MEQNIKSDTEIKAISLFDRLEAKRKFHNKKWDRARKWENQDFHYKKMRLYADISHRAWKLVFAIRNKSRFGEQCVLLRYDKENYVKNYTERIKKQKEEAKNKFDSRYRISLWFYSESLTADYGTHQCDKCSRTYHHSPSEVYLGAKKEYSNACGYCVNNLLEFNRQETIFC